MIGFIERRDERRQRIQSAREAAAAAAGGEGEGGGGGEAIEDDHTYGAVKRRSSLSSTPSSASSTSSPAFYFSSSSAEDVSSFRTQAATLRAEAAEARDKAQCLRSGSQKSLLLSLAVSKENRAQALLAAADVAEQEARDVAEGRIFRREGREDQQCTGQRTRPEHGDEEEENRQQKRNTYSAAQHRRQDDAGSSRETGVEWTRRRREGGEENQEQERHRQYPSDPSWETHSSRSSRQGLEDREEHRPLCSPASSTSGQEARTPLESRIEGAYHSREAEDSQGENIPPHGEFQVENPSPFDPPWVRHARLLRREAAEQRDRAQCVRGTKQRALLLVAQKKEKEANELLLHRGLVPDGAGVASGEDSTAMSWDINQGRAPAGPATSSSSSPFPPASCSSSSSTSLGAFNAFNAAWASSQQAVAAGKMTGSSVPPRSYSSSSGGESGAFSTRASTSRQSSSFSSSLVASPLSPPAPPADALGLDAVEDKNLAKVRELQMEAAAMRDKAALVRGSKQRALILTAELREKEAEKLLNAANQGELLEKEEKPSGCDLYGQPSQLSGCGRGGGSFRGDCEGVRRGERSFEEEQERQTDRWRHSTQGAEGRTYGEYQGPGINSYGEGQVCSQPFSFPSSVPPFLPPAPLPSASSSSSCPVPSLPGHQQRPLYEESPHLSPVLADVQRLRQEALVLRDKASCCSGAKARQLRSMADLKEQRAETLLLSPAPSSNRRDGGGGGGEVKKELDAVEMSHRLQPAEAPYTRDLFLQSGQEAGDVRASSLRPYKRESEGGEDTNTLSPFHPSSAGGQRLPTDDRHVPVGERVTSRTGGCPGTPSREPQGSCSGSLDADEENNSPYSEIPEWQRSRQLMQEVRANREKANCVGGGRQRQLLAIAAAKERQAEELKKKAMEIYSLSRATSPAEREFPGRHYSPYPPPPAGGGGGGAVGERVNSGGGEGPSSWLDYEEETVVVPQEKTADVSSRQLHRNFGRGDEGQQQQEHLFDFSRHFEGASLSEADVSVKTHSLGARGQTHLMEGAASAQIVGGREHRENERDSPEEGAGSPLVMLRKGDQQGGPVALPPPRLTRFSTQDDNALDEDEGGPRRDFLKKQERAEADGGTLLTKVERDARSRGAAGLGRRGLTDDEDLSLHGPPSPLSPALPPSSDSSGYYSRMSIKRTTTTTTTSSRCPPSDANMRAPYLVGPGGEEDVISVREMGKKQQEGSQTEGELESRNLSLNPEAVEELRRHQDALQRQLKLVEEQLLSHTQREAQAEQRRLQEMIALASKERGGG